MKRKILVDQHGKICNGEIEILKKKDRKAYVKWIIHDQENNLVASLTRSYFLGADNKSDDEIFQIVQNAILNYRIGRKTIFSKIDFEE
jgi:hypothetical protein